MKKLLIAAAAAAMTVTVPAVAEETAAPAQKVAYSTADSSLGVLMDNPATKAVLDKHMPGLTSNPQLTQARSLTLKQLQQFAPDRFSDDLMAKIDADLAPIPAAK
jgi:hypothetical protein